MDFDENEGIDWNEIADPNSACFEDELLDELEAKEIEEQDKKRKKELLGLTIEEFAKLPKDIIESLMVDDLLVELEEIDDKRVFALYCKSLERKCRAQFDERNCLPGKYGEKRYAHKYNKRDVPQDYELKAKYILDNLQVDYEKYKVCKQVRNGKVIFIPVGMKYEEMNGLIKNIHCLFLRLKQLI